MVYIAVLDDEENIGIEMESYLSEIQKILDIKMKVSFFQKAENLLSEMEERPYDIVFLDIELGGDNGINTAQILRKRYPAVVIVFITAHYQYVYEVFDVRPCGFIRKPLEKKDVEHTLNTALKECEYEAVLKYFSNSHFYRVLLKDIYYIVSEKRKIYIIKAGETVSFYDKLEEIEKKLLEQSCKFLRISQSIIVNTKYLKQISYKQAVVTTDRGDETFNISQKYQVQVRKWCLEMWKS